MVYADLVSAPSEHHNAYVSTRQPVGVMCCYYPPLAIFPNLIGSKWLQLSCWCTLFPPCHLKLQFSAMAMQLSALEAGIPLACSMKLQEIKRKSERVATESPNRCVNIQLHGFYSNVGRFICNCKQSGIRRHIRKSPARVGSWPISFMINSMQTMNRVGRTVTGAVAATVTS